MSSATAPVTFRATAEQIVALNAHAERQLVSRSELLAQYAAEGLQRDYTADFRPLTKRIAGSLPRALLGKCHVIAQRRSVNLRDVLDGLADSLIGVIEAEYNEKSNHVQ